MDVCRACMSSSHTLVDIFCDRPLADYEFSLAEMLNELVDFKVDRDDKLPQRICVTCGLNAQIAFKFKRRFQLSHQLLCMKVMEKPEDVAVLDTETTDEVKENIKDFESKSDLKHKRKLHKKQRTRCEKLIKERSLNDCKDVKDYANDLDQAERSTLDDAEPRKAHRYPLRQSRRKPALNYNEKLANPVELRSRLRKFKCDQCTKSFTSSQNLKRHQISHDGKRNYKCLHCPKTYHKQSKLQRHIKSHSQDHRHLCGQCSRAFNCRSDLIIHIQTHSEARPFVCPYCQFAFKSYFHLYRHLRNHLGQRPFKCEACNKSFTTKWNLKSHMNTPNRCAAQKKLNLM
ncbi:zinc finger protein 425-like [Drosophila hydei]|uniref:Zinc finger protein 425-like n=1 Tax=Drosophila hydei TaxID=7224 RepID=A0A6J1M1X0_DROHY|nr:zinc finger protein 425-like [Drosophila hydei]